MQPLAARPDAAAGPQQWAALAGAQADALAALAGEILLARAWVMQVMTTCYWPPSVLA